MVKNLDDIDISELTPLTKKQILKFEAIKNHVNDQFEADNENARAIFNQFRRFEVIIVQNWDSSKKEYQVFNTQNNDELTGQLLDQKLNEIMESITQFKRTLPHAKPTNDGKFQSITVSMNRGPSNDFINSILGSAKIDIPLQVRIDIARRSTQEEHSLIKDLTEQERIQRMVELEARYKVCIEAVQSDFKKVKNERFKELEQARILNQVKPASQKSKSASLKPKTEKPIKVKISKEDQKVWNLLKADATQEQFQAKKKQMIALGLLEIAEPIIVDATGEKQKFKIETTSSKEESYNGDKS